MPEIPHNTPMNGSAIPTHGEIRRGLFKAHRTSIAYLSRLDLTKRLEEIGIFVVLWLVSLLLNYTGIQTHSLILRVIGTFGTALAINGFILLMHEGMHGVLFAGRSLNRWAAVALGLNFCMSFSAYRVLHTRHHQYLGDPRDPDDYNNYTGRRGLVWLMQYLRLIIGPYLYILVMPFLAYRYGSPVERRNILVEYAILLPLYALAFILLPASYILWMWFVPLIGAAHLTAIRGLSQHAVTEPRDPYLASRSIDAGPLVRFFMLNENYHLEHHLFPELPSYHLAAAHRLIAPQLPRTVMTRSYIGFLLRFFKQSLHLDETPIGLSDPARA